jgi:beta-N-acetylhexosaminidase
MTLARLTASAMLALLCGAAADRRAPASEDAVARLWMRQMTLAEKVAQLVMVPFYGDNPNQRAREYREFSALVRELRAGGLIILNRVRGGVVQKAEPLAMAAFLNRMQRLAKVPLLVGADFERGASMRVNGTTQFPHAMAFGAAGDLEATRELGRITAREARALGAHWVFAPVADVNNNPDNPIINIRSFSEKPEVVSAHVKAFIEGAHSDPQRRILVCAKHFPGHGDTATDSHLGLGAVTADRPRLEAVELVPFRAAIEAGVDSIMTAHLHVPALEPEAIPATVSKSIMTGLLREELKFNGLLSTDAMDMQGLAKMFPPGEAAVRALEAGVDLLLIPTDPRAAVKGVLDAVRSGRLSKQRIDESLLRMLKAKAGLGLHRRRLVDLDSLADSVAAPEDEDLALRVAAGALALRKNDGNVVPLRRDSKACVIVLTGARASTAGRDFLEELRRRAPAWRAWSVDPQYAPAEFDRIAAAAEDCEAVVLAAFVAASAYRGTVGLTGPYPPFVEKLLSQKPPVVLVSFGNPYLDRAYPNSAAYLATYSTSAPSEAAAAARLLP